MIGIHSVSEYKKRYIRNSTQILENLRNAVVGFFGLRNEFASVQGNKKRNTQNIQIKKQKKPNDVELLLVKKQKRSQIVDNSATVKGQKVLTCIKRCNKEDFFCKKSGFSFFGKFKKPA